MNVQVRNGHSGGLSVLDGDGHRVRMVVLLQHAHRTRNRLHQIRRLHVRQLVHGKDRSPRQHKNVSGNERLQIHRAVAIGAHVEYLAGCEWNEAKGHAIGIFHLLAPQNAVEEILQRADTSATSPSNRKPTRPYTRSRHLNFRLLGSRQGGSDTVRMGYPKSNDGNHTINVPKVRLSSGERARSPTQSYSQRHSECVLGFIRGYLDWDLLNCTYLRGASQDERTNTALREGTAEGIHVTLFRLRITFSHQLNTQSLAEGVRDENVQNGPLVHQLVNGIHRLLDCLHAVGKREFK